MTKDVNVKALNMKTRTNEVKTSVQHISMIANVKSIIQHIIQIKIGIMINANVVMKRMCKKDYSWNPSILVCENNRYLNSFADNSIIACDKIINITDSLSTNVTSIISANIRSTVSIHSDDEKVRYKMICYILHTFLLVTILWFIIALICYHYMYENFDWCKSFGFIRNLVVEFIRNCDGSKHLVLFGPEKHDAIFNKIRYLIR